MAFERLSEYFEPRILWYHKILSFFHESIPSDSLPSSRFALTIGLIKLLIYFSSFLHFDRDPLKSTASEWSILQILTNLIALKPLLMIILSIYFLASFLIIALFLLNHSFAKANSSTKSRSSLLGCIRYFHESLVRGSAFLLLLVYAARVRNEGLLTSDQASNRTLHVIALSIVVFTIIYETAMLYFWGCIFQKSRTLEFKWKIPLPLFSYIENWAIFYLFYSGTEISRFEFHLATHILLITQTTELFYLHTQLSMISTVMMTLNGVLYAVALIDQMIFPLTKTNYEPLIRLSMLLSFLILSIIFVCQKRLFTQKYTVLDRRQYKFMLTQILNNWNLLKQLESDFISKLDGQSALSNSQQKKVWFAYLLQSHSINCSKINCFCQNNMLNFSTVGTSAEKEQCATSFVLHMVRDYLRMNPSDIFLRFRYIEFMIKQCKNRIEAILESKCVSQHQISFRHWITLFSVKIVIGEFFRANSRGILPEHTSDIDVQRFIKTTINFDDYKAKRDVLARCCLEFFNELRHKRSTFDTLSQRISALHQAKLEYLTSAHRFKDRYEALCYRKLIKICIPEINIESSKEGNGDKKHFISRFTSTQDSCYLLVSLGKNELGRIMAVHQNVKIMLGYEPINLISNYLTVFLPPKFGIGHNRALESYLSHGQGDHMNGRTNFFLKNLEGYIAHVQLSVKNFFNYKESLPCSFSIFNKHFSDEELILCDKRGKILSITEGLKKKTKWRFHSNNFDENIQNIIPKSGFIFQTNHRPSKSLPEKQVPKRTGGLYDGMLYLDFMKYKEAEESLTEGFSTMNPVHLGSTSFFHQPIENISYIKHKQLIQQMPIQKFTISFDFELIETSDTRFFLVRIVTLKRVAVKDSILNHKIFVFIFRTSLLKLVLRKYLRRKEKALYNFLLCFKQEIVKLDMSKRRISRYIVPVRSSGFLQLKKELSKSVDVSALKNRVQNKLFRLRLMSLFSFAMILFICVMKIRILSDFSKNLPQNLSQSFANLRRQHNLMKSTFMIPFQILQTSTTQKAADFSNQIESLFGYRMTPAPPVPTHDSAILALEDLLFGHVKDSYLQSLITLQSHELTPDFSPDNISDISVRISDEDSVIPLVSNVHDAFVYLNFIQQDLELEPTDFRNFRQTFFNILNHQAAYLKVNPIYLSLVSDLNTIQYILLGCSAGLSVIAIILVFRLAESYRNFHRCLAFVSTLTLKPSKRQFLKSFSSSKAQKAESITEEKSPPAANSQRTNFRRLDMRNLARFSFVFLFPFVAAFAILTVFVLIVLTHNRKTLDSSTDLISSLIELDTLVCSGMISLQVSKPDRLIESGEFNNRMNSLYSSIFVAKVHGNSFVSSFNLKESICEYLTDPKIEHCEALFNGLLVQGYEKIVRKLIHEMTNMLDSHLSMFLFADHKQTYALALILIHFNTYLLNEAISSNLSSITWIQNADVALIIAVIIIIVGLTLFFLCQLKRLLADPWEHVIPMLKHLSQRAIKTNSLLQLFLRGDYV